MRLIKSGCGLFLCCLLVLIGCSDEAMQEAVMVEEVLVEEGTVDASNFPPWELGVFEDEALFKGLCEAPRSGINPYTGSPYEDQQGSYAFENHWLRSWSNRTYLWYDEIEDKNPSLYPSVPEYFSLLKTTALTASGQSKDKFHFTYDTQAWEQLTSESAEVGYGIAWAISDSYPPLDVRITYIDSDTQAEALELARGFSLIEVDAIELVNVDSYEVALEVYQALYPDVVGETHSFTFSDSEGQSLTVTLTAAFTTAKAVHTTGYIDTDKGRVGYLLFNSFLPYGAEKQLVEAFDYFAGLGLQEMIVDLRYNSGGFLVTASQLGYMLTSPSINSGKVFEELQFNDKHTEIDINGFLLEPYLFYDTTFGFSLHPGQPLPYLGFNRLVILATEDTCSASESVINALLGIDVEVILIGSTTCGKPYGFYAKDNCGTTYFTIQFRGINDKGFGDYSDGFIPSEASNGQNFVRGCEVADDLDQALGDPQESMLAAALGYLASGQCPLQTLASKTPASSTTAEQSKGISLYDSEYLQMRQLLKRSLIITPASHQQQ